MHMKRRSSHSWIDWDKVVAKKQRAGSRDKVKHIKRNDQLFVTKMTQMGERE